MDILEVPEVLELPRPAPNEGYPSATADYVMTALLRRQPAMLHAVFLDGCGRWLVQTSNDGDTLITESKGVGEFRAVLARFGAHYMDTQLYGGHVRRTISQARRKFACEIFMSNQGWTGFWIRVYARAV